MSVVLHTLSEALGLNPWILQSWREIFDAKKTKKTENIEDFLRTNQTAIKAQPFVKWVGGKRQLIKQFEQFFPEKFNDYYEPFL